MTSRQLKNLYFQFFQERGHALIPSASLLPDNDPTTLFTTAGMHPLVPYLMGESHPQGRRLVDVQKCLRTGDIEDVGDATHLTFFEMLGNWSLGDYFKAESIPWSYEFLTSKKYLGLDPERLHVTVFAGEGDIPRDEESARIWKSLGIPDKRIYYLGRDDNFWGPVGETGPCGPDTEIFYDTGKEPCSAECAPGCRCGKYFEIWNNVFMEFEKKAGGSYVPLKQKNVDTGMGVERTIAMLNGTKTVYDIDTFEPLLEYIKRQAKMLAGNEVSLNVITDHLRAAVFLLADDKSVKPSNVDQGYVLRRLIRRVIRHAKKIGLDVEHLKPLAQLIIREYHVDYPELTRNSQVVFDELDKEEQKFIKTLDQGLKAFDKYARDGHMTAKDAFTLYSSYGFPLEMIEEVAKEKNVDVDSHGFEEFVRQHSEKSRTAAAGKFKGGLADHSAMTTKYHTATHMTLEALKRVLGREVEQRGSNITSERMRFDFNYPTKMTAEQVKQVEDIVNTEIAKEHSVHFEVMSVDEAKKRKATGVFEHKYGDKVKVYFVGDYSTEICGGPHVDNTKGMGRIKITKEEAVSAGVRRIKAILE